MSSLLQSTGSSPYVLVHIVGPLTATIQLLHFSQVCTRLIYVASPEIIILFLDMASIVACDKVEKEPYEIST